MYRFGLCFFILSALAVTPNTALAYGSSAGFEASLANGGGDGHFFTGSISDRYTCMVCHDGPRQDTLRLEGFPADGYRPGETYALRLSWMHPLGLAGETSVAVEWVNSAGHQAGTLEPADADIWSEDELCDGEPAIDTRNLMVGPELSGSRQVLVADDCARRAIHLSWTAPATDVGPVSLHASAVHTNDDSNTTGDTTSVLRHLSAVQGAPPPEASTLANCTVAPRHAESFVPAFLLMLMAIFIPRRRRRSP